MTKRLLALGLLSLIPYLYALYLQDLRVHTLAFVIVFFAAFGIYAIATLLALRTEAFPRPALAVVFAAAIGMQAVLIFTRPTLSDDMYRYVWDGKVQAQGISPYRYPPDAPELAVLRDQAIWPSINRKSAVTIYPPAAEMAFTLLWRIWPDNARWFQAAMAAGGLLAGVLLLGVLRELGRSPGRVLIYLWSPLLAFETAHSAHLDGLVLPVLVGAWWARLRQRDGWVGILLGLATALKLYPALLFPALWRPNHRQGRWRMPLAFLGTLTVCYLPYLIQSGAGVIGFLPQYLRELFNQSPLLLLLSNLFQKLAIDPRNGVPLAMLATLGVSGLWMILHPARDGEHALRRSLWLIGAFTLFAQDLFSWYMLWLLPLAAIFLESGRLALRADAWSGWWLFCGLIGLSYLFFIRWKPIPWTMWAQFLPLYGFLLVDLVRTLWVGTGSLPARFHVKNLDADYAEERGKI